MILDRNQRMGLLAFGLGLIPLYCQPLAAEDVFSCQRKQDCSLQQNPCTRQLIAVNQKYNRNAFRDNPGCQNVKGATNAVGNEADCRAGQCVIQVLSPKNYPPEYQEATLWLQSLARERQTLHGPIGSPMWNKDLLLNAISEAGLILTNVNDPDKKPKVLTRQEVVSQIRDAKDPLAQYISHIGQMYNENRSQYSSLYFEPDGQGLDIRMGVGYRFHFIHEGGHYKLREIHYLITEGD